ncbi:YceK/YidQ family lipoprotein [Pseudomonas sp. YH-1]|uniref:YceK/YidQ family lipoprotein n=1 Tax=Pseudomonas sp. YH-1 TaxID=3384787 RepID=UPI003F818490
MATRLRKGVQTCRCVMNGDGQRRGGALYRVPPMPIFDMGLSAVADTLALPYTLYRQDRDGDIQLLRD